MALTVDGTYEDGVLKLDQPLPLPESDRVRVTLLRAIGDGENAPGATGSIRHTSTRAVQKDRPIDGLLVGGIAGAVASTIVAMFVVIFGIAVATVYFVYFSTPPNIWVSIQVLLVLGVALSVLALPAGFAAGAIAGAITVKRNGRGGDRRQVIAAVCVAAVATAPAFFLAKADNTLHALAVWGSFQLIASLAAAIRGTWVIRRGMQ